MIKSLKLKSFIFTFYEEVFDDSKEPISKKRIFKLAQFDSLNVSLDGWSDAILRSFNGYVVQGIYNNIKHF